MGTPSLPCLRYPPSAGFCVWGRLSLTGQARTHKVAATPPAALHARALANGH